MKQSELLYKDFMVTEETFSLVPIEQYPGLLRTHPTPDSKNLERYYESDAYLSHANEAKGWLSWLYFQVKKINLKRKYTLIQNNISGNKILDYGCGTGELVKYLNNKNLNAYGFEPNSQAYNIAKFKNPGNIYSTNDFLNDEKFDVITLWHVLEHIPNLEEILTKLKSSLRPNGKLLIAVPNYKSFDAQHYQNYWAAYDVPRHIWHFDQESMLTLLNKFGMIIESTYPMLFDSFYVSLLSEKYKNSSFGFMKAFMIGLISNLKAAKTGEFSSLIYEVRLK